MASTILPGERMTPLHFAGRADELRQFDEDLHTLCGTGQSNGLRLVMGVPGSGKTRLAEEFERRVHGGVVNGVAVSALTISVNELRDPLTMFETIGRAINAEQAASEIARIDDRIANVSGGVLGSSVAVAKDVGRHTSAFAGLLRKSADRGMWKKKALVLLVDELQSINADGMPALQVLHEGLSRCRIMLAGFGLNHTLARLASFPDNQGISRVATPMVLHPLAAVDAHDVLSRSLEQLGHQRVSSDGLDELVKASHGFPQHINSYLEGAHRALTRYGHLEGKPLQEALRHGHERRVGYYNQRLATGHLHRPMLAVVAALDRNKKTVMNYHDTIHELEQAGFGKPDLESAIAHGALSCDMEDNVSFGIPSFHAYMARMLANERELSRSAGASASEK